MDVDLLSLYYESVLQGDDTLEYATDPVNIICCGSAWRIGDTANMTSHYNIGGLRNRRVALA